MESFNKNKILCIYIKEHKLYMKSYLLNYDKDIEKMINSISAKRALKGEYKIERLSELLRSLIKEEYERLNK